MVKDSAGQDIRVGDDVVMYSGMGEGVCDSWGGSECGVVRKVGEGWIEDEKGRRWDVAHVVKV